MVWLPKRPVEFAAGALKVEVLPKMGCVGDVVAGAVTVVVIAGYSTCVVGCGARLLVVAGVVEFADYAGWPKMLPLTGLNALSD